MTRVIGTGPRLKIKVALGDLRHHTLGRHSVFMPVGIGYIASYSVRHNGLAHQDIRLYDEPEEMISDLKSWMPDIIALSHYCWNAELSLRILRLAKELNPRVICIAGGPEFPRDERECLQYLIARKEIDFFVYQEGEIGFARLLSKVMAGFGLDALKAEAQDGIMHIDSKGKLIRGKPIPRLIDMDDIPSPYLTGLMDKWFNGEYAPSVETARGCPYTCAYCYAQDTCYSKVTRFSLERLREELEYIAQRMKDYPGILLSICDSNFGMYAEDEELAKCIAQMRTEHGWPNAFDVTTGKSNYDRILRIADLLDNKMNVSCSVQSMNPATLEAIKRMNLPIQDYKKIYNEILARGSDTSVELIIPMPEETKDTFIEGIKVLFDAGVNAFTVYTLMLLKGTSLASQESRHKYSMVTKYRIIPRQFGEYEGERCFEIEEVCIQTNTMPFEEYLDCRGFGFVSSLVSSPQYDVVLRHIEELGIPKHDYLLFVFKSLEEQRGVSNTYQSYIRESRDELWDSREGLKEFFSKQENYNRLLSGHLGDNLMRKYKTMMMTENGREFTEFLYHCIKQMLKVPDKMTLDSLDAARTWLIETRDVLSMFKDPGYRERVDRLTLNYDVLAWYNKDSKPLNDYSGTHVYRIYSNQEKISKLFESARRLYKGGELSYFIGKTMINWSIKNFWRECRHDSSSRLRHG